MFSLFLLVNNFDLIKFVGTRVGTPKVWMGPPCSAEQGRTFLNSALPSLCIHTTRYSLFVCRPIIDVSCKRDAVPEHSLIKLIFCLDCLIGKCQGPCKVIATCLPSG